MFFMKGKFIGVGILLLVLTACAATRKAPKPDDNLDGAWKLAVFMPSQKKTLAEVFGERIAELQLNKATNSVTGTTGCNKFAGTFTSDTTRLTFSQNHVTTKMACPGFDEQIFLNTLNRVNRYRLVESQLELMQNDEIVMIFAKKLQQ
jgi:heat shock protein HslJ